MSSSFHHVAVDAAIYNELVELHNFDPLGSSECYINAAGSVRYVMEGKLIDPASLEADRELMRGAFLLVSPEKNEETGT